jgi:hypothetical protein
VTSSASWTKAVAAWPLARQSRAARWARVRSVLTPHAELPGPGASHSQRLTLLTFYQAGFRMYLAVNRTRRVSYQELAVHKGAL